MAYLTVTAIQQEKFRQKFLRTVRAVPHKVVFSVVEVGESGNFMSDFVGDNPRETNDKRVEAFYRRNFSNRDRTKFGLSENTSAIVYVSPLTLKKAFNTSAPKVERVQVEGVTYVVTQTIEMGVLHDSPLFIELRLSLPENV